MITNANPERCTVHGFDSNAKCFRCRRARYYREGYVAGLADREASRLDGPLWGNR